jgi:caffeoyl-CoA O-methyltransferase
VHNKFTIMTEELYGYVLAHRTERDPVLAELVEETEQIGWQALMQVAPEQGALLTMLARISGAKKAVEVGTFTGYSAISIARGLVSGGRLLCCDISPQWAAIARRYFAKAGLDDRIQLEVAPAIETLRALPAMESIDFAFIDADKVSYRLYYEEILARMRGNGLIVFDNVLWSGKVADETDRSVDTIAIRELNDFVASDERVECVMVGVADGLLLARKRAPGEGRKQ